MRLPAVRPYFSLLPPAFAGGLMTLCIAAGFATGDVALASDAGNETNHWAYQPIRRPALPASNDRAGITNPIDRFIHARLAEESLSPSAEADRTTLIRRVTFDLIGLPPTPDEVAAFLADPSPDAYERLVDRLLASPRYGERMAVPWLDLARYADTHGYHSDSQRQMWRWRDWVIDAYNAGMPFDQFTIEQLAGDLLPKPTLEQRLATGLHRNHMLNDENGAIPEEYLAEYIAERVSTTGTIWLGQTLSCARCHDHKYDPFSQQDFYQLYAFFHNVPENGLGGRNGNAPPVLTVPTKLQQQELNELGQRLADVRNKLIARANSAGQDMRKWESQLSVQSESLHAPPTDAVAHLQFDGKDEKQALNAADSTLPALLKGNPSWVPGKFQQSLLFDGETWAELPLVLGNGVDESFTLAAWAFPTTSDVLPIISRLDETQYRRGFEWRLDEGRPEFRLTHQDGKNEIVVRAVEALPLRRWQHLAITHDGSGRASGIQLWANGQPVPTEVVADELSAHIATDQPLRIGRSDETTHFRGMLDEIQIFRRALSSSEIAVLAGGDPIRDLVRIPADKRTAAQEAEVTRYFLQNVDETYTSLHQTEQQLQRQQTQLLRLAPTAMVMVELPAPRKTHILVGGAYDALGDEVTANTPAALPAMPAGAPRNRLGLAQWLVHPDHPLTARVAVNRHWQTFFGTGLVRTPEGFGTRGERPTHPDLLDWLAREYIGRGWDTKRLQRLIVTSATYRQTSVPSPEVADRDPDNRWLACGPRKPLPAEAVRDAALHAAGLLQVNLGGPSVRPYQPAELWRELAYDPANYSAQVFEQSHGADLYRRSLYTFWKRSVPPPDLSLLDAPDRETCTAARTPTTTPLQALVLLNDTAYVEAARVIAQRVVTQAEPSLSSRIDFASRLILSRPATDDEQRTLGRLWHSQHRRFSADSAAARKLIEVGDSPAADQVEPAELAAWTTLVSVLLNFDEAVTCR